MNIPRSSGILLHPTSLPGPDGVGRLGAQARRFVDTLAESGQTWWQILPLNPPGHGGSPYSAISAFGGNPVLIDLEELVEKGWLDGEELEGMRARCAGVPEDEFAIDVVTQVTYGLLHQAFEVWLEEGGDKDASFEAFVDKEAYWLDDYALFVTLKEFHGGASWQDWDPAFVRRDEAALKAARLMHGPMILEAKFRQWLFFEQWGRLRDYAREKGIKFIGDIPIFVAMDSADAWANREIFELDALGRPSAIAGVPPDYFSETGQRWGNPLYDWAAMEAEGYRFWIDRTRKAMETVDLVRIDHFRGFAAYWRVPAEEPTAMNGTWIEGPKDAVFEAIREALGDVPFIAEDLALITEDVTELRDRQGLPGMKVLQFAFDGDPEHPFLPHTYPEHAVAYTGTHDNDTTQGWYDQLDEEERHRVRAYLNHGDEGIVWAMFDAALASRARLVVFPVQDLFELGTHARMNVPGVAEDNWAWRMPEALLEDKGPWWRLEELTKKYGR
ncbi:MAG: 4-alpha-glucanotransferase [Bradymonadaceae bacterium]